MNKATLSYRFSLLLTTAALLLLSYSFVQAKLNLNGYGLINSLPPSFFVALALLTIAAALLWLSQERHYWLLAIQTLFLILSLYLTPFLVEGTVRLSAAYQNYGFIDYVMRTGQLNPQIVWYHSYPGFPLFFASFFQILGIKEPLLTIALFPAIIEVLFLLPLFLLFKNVKGSIGNMWWMAAWIFIIANWTNQEYFSPQAMAYLLMLYLLALILKNMNSEVKNVSTSVLIIILIFALTITHMITSVAALLIFGGLTILWRKRDFSTTLLFTIVIGAWAIYGAIFLVKSYFPTFLTQAFQPDQFLFFTYIFRFTETSPEHSVINNIRVIFTAVFILIAIFGALWPNREGRASKTNLSFLLIALCPMLMLPAFVYGGEFIIRVFLLLLVPVAYFSLKLMRTKAVVWIFTAILIALSPVYMLAHYGNELAEYIPPAEVKFSDFFFEQTTKGRLLGMDPPVFYKGLGQYQFYILYSTTPDPEYKDRMLAIESKPPPNKLFYTKQYVSLTNRLYNAYSLFLNQGNRIVEAKSWIDSAVQYNLIYSNSEVALYLWE